MAHVRRFTSGNADVVERKLNMGEDDKRIVVGIIDDDGQFQEIGSPVDFDDPKTIESDDLETILPHFVETELGFTPIPPDGLSVFDLILCIACGIDTDKIRQNNWRKLHGLPMKMRKHHGIK